MSRRAEAIDPQRLMERETRYGQKPPVGQRTEVVSVFPAEADEIEAATRCVSKHAVNVADRADLLEALGLVGTQATKARTRNGKTSHGRGRCPHCSRRTSLVQSGLIGEHKGRGKGITGACPGSGKQPKAEVPLADDPEAGKTAVEGAA